MGSFSSIARAFGKFAGGRPPEDLAFSIVRQVQGVLREQFQKGIDPSGNTYAPKRDGKPAFYRKMKIPQDFQAQVIPTGLRFFGRIDWMSAHQEGHTFPARHIAANKQYLSFSAKGKLVSERRIFRTGSIVRKGAYQRFARAHEVSARVLPQRPIYPTSGTLPRRWFDAVKRGAEAGMEEIFGDITAVTR